MRWSAGQLVSVVGGMFAGHEGIVVGVEVDKVLVRLSLYERDVVVRIPPDQLRFGPVTPDQRLAELLDERLSLATTMQLNDWWLAHVGSPAEDAALWEEFEAWRHNLLSASAARRDALFAALSVETEGASRHDQVDRLLAVKPLSDEESAARAGALERAFERAERCRKACEARRRN